MRPCLAKKGGRKKREGKKGAREGERETKKGRREGGKKKIIQKGIKRLSMST